MSRPTTAYGRSTPYIGAGEAIVIVFVVALLLFGIAIAGAVGLHDVISDQSPAAQWLSAGAVIAGGALLAVYIIAFGSLGAWVGEQKGRSPLEGALLGMLLGFIGIFLEALLPEFPHERYPPR